VYFQAFRESHQSPLPPQQICAIEHLVGQMLATADINALELALQKQRLVDMLVDELDFLGHILRSDLPKVQAYLIQHGSTLSEAAQRLIREPDNDAIREELCSSHVAVARG
jgi:hypothetical protein